MSRARVASRARPGAHRETQRRAPGRIAEKVADDPVLQTTKETVEVTLSGLSSDACIRPVLPSLCRDTVAQVDVF